MAVFPLDDPTRDHSSPGRSGLDLQFLNRLRWHWDGLLGSLEEQDDDRV